MTTNKKTPQFFGIHARPGKIRWVLVLLPFVLVLSIYLFASDARHQENPADKLLPEFSQMGKAMYRAAFVENKRTGDLLLWKDTVASLTRLLIGVSLAAMVGLLLGLNNGLFPGMDTTMNPFITFISMVPPLAILPILFISFGVGEMAKVALIFLGLFPLISRDIRLAVKKIPGEQITKAATLGATQLQLTYRIILPQIMPRLIQAVRLSIGAAWLFLIASEAIAAEEGLGYRIFLVRRYLAMDLILPYVLWITLLGYFIDWLLRLSLSWFYPWYQSGDDR